MMQTNFDKIKSMVNHSADLDEMVDFLHWFMEHARETWDDADICCFGCIERCEVYSVKEHTCQGSYAGIKNWLGSQAVDWR